MVNARSLVSGITPVKDFNKRNPDRQRYVLRFDNQQDMNSAFAIVSNHETLGLVDGYSANPDSNDSRPNALTVEVAAGKDVYVLVDDLTAS